MFSVLDLKDESVRDDVTSGGRLFHVLAAAMGNARSPMVRVPCLEQRLRSDTCHFGHFNRSCYLLTYLL